MITIMMMDDDEGDDDEESGGDLECVAQQHQSRGHLVLQQLPPDDEDDYQGCAGRGRTRICQVGRG